jgi:hypothetical protein
MVVAEFIKNRYVYITRFITNTSGPTESVLLTPVDPEIVSHSVSHCVLSYKRFLYR